MPSKAIGDAATSEAVVKAFVDNDFTNPELVYIQSFASANLKLLNETIMPKYGVSAFQSVWWWDKDKAAKKKSDGRDKSDHDEQ